MVELIVKLTEPRQHRPLRMQNNVATQIYHTYLSQQSA